VSGPGALPVRSLGSPAAVLIGAGLGATLLLHGALLLAILVGRGDGGRVARPPELGQVVEVSAVKFGKPRDLRFLPHKEAPPPPRPKPTVVLSQDEQALPGKPPEALPRLDEPLPATPPQADPQAAPDNTGSAAEEGDPGGLRGGSATVGKGPVYLQHLVAAVQNAWVVPPSISDEQLARLKAQACIRIDPSGRITQFRISVPSGNERFDATLLDALASIRTFDPPSEERIAPGGPTVRQLIVDQGVCLNFENPPRTAR
jgi:hypothetical protein